MKNMNMREFFIGHGYGKSPTWRADDARTLKTTSNIGAAVYAVDLFAFWVLRKFTKNLSELSKFGGFFKSTKTHIALCAIIHFAITAWIYETLGKNTALYNKIESKGSDEYVTNTADISEFSGEVIFPAIASAFALHLMLSSKFSANKFLSSNYSFVALFALTALAFGASSRKGYNTSTWQYNGNVAVDNENWLVIFDMAKNLVETFFAVSIFSKLVKNNASIKDNLKFTAMLAAAQGKNINY